MPLVTRSPDPACPLGGFSPPAGRPLFVPPGIVVVRTGPTTRAELERLLADAPDAADACEASGVRLRPLAATAPSWLGRLSAALGFSSTATR